jgi:hypothetical protein
MSTRYSFAYLSQNIFLLVRPLHASQRRAVVSPPTPHSPQWAISPCTPSTTLLAPCSCPSRAPPAPLAPCSRSPTHRAPTHAVGRGARLCYAIGAVARDPCWWYSRAATPRPKSIVPGLSLSLYVANVCFKYFRCYQRYITIVSYGCCKSRS